MNEEQAIALSDASERLVCAYVSGSQRAVDAAKEDLRIARDMSDGAPSSAVVARLIQNDPINAAAAGLLAFPELQAIIASDLDAHLKPDEVAVVADNPANLRMVLAARMSGLDLAEMIRKPLLDRQDFALAARGNRRRAAELVAVLQESLDKVKKISD
jgi:hypothetical protein